MAGKAEIGPHRIGEESPSALARFEIAHERGERVGVLGDLDEALIDIGGMPARRDIAVDAGEPAIGREAEFPGIDWRRLDIGRARAWPDAASDGPLEAFRPQSPGFSATAPHRRQRSYGWQAAPRPTGRPKGRLNRSK
jgi:hypothetical protein